MVKSKCLYKCYLLFLTIFYGFNFVFAEYEVSKGSNICCDPVSGVYTKTLSERDAFKKEIEKRFTEANSYYEKGNYANATVILEMLISDYHVQNFSVLYNLGNSYYRQNNIGKAVLNYERAYLLNHRDEDLKHNLLFVKSGIKDIEPQNLLKKMFIFFSTGEISFIFTLFNFLFFGVLCLFIKTKHRSSKILIRRLELSLLILLLVSGMWCMARIIEEGKIYGVIISSSEVRSGPNSNYSAGISLTEGKRVMILGEEGDWYAVGLPVEKYKGWVEKPKVERI
ncbi:MAG: tetratricopeptide repeat protein [Elusimicrobiota bacterium]